MNLGKYDFVIVGSGVMGLTLSIELKKTIFTELLIMDPK
jgi:L-2-hydroxyglutarate oxidase LhgO